MESEEDSVSVFKRIYDAYYLGRASDEAAQGNVKRGLKFITKVRQPTRNKAVTEALRAYLYILNQKNEKAKEAIESARESASPNTENGRFVRKYCDYITAILVGSVEDFNALSSELRDPSVTCRAKSLLVVDRPAPFEPTQSVGFH